MAQQECLRSAPAGQGGRQSTSGQPPAVSELARREVAVLPKPHVDDALVLATPEAALGGRVAARKICFNRLDRHT